MVKTVERQSWDLPVDQQPDLGREASTAPRLLTLETGYSLENIRALRLEHEVLCRDLDGFFDHVWTVHPAIGATPTHAVDSTVGAPSTVKVSDRHTVVEAKVGRYGSLARLPRLNFALAQATLLLQLLRLVRRERISIVRACDPYYMGVFGVVLGRASGLPLVVRINANQDFTYETTGQTAYPRLIPSRRMEQLISRFVLGRADLVVAGNEDNLRFALANGAPAERSTVFRCGTWVDPVHFETEPQERPSVRADLDLGERPYLIFVSRLEPAKHPEDVLEVLAKAKACHPELAAVVVGDGTQRESLEALAADLELSDDVRLVGTRDQKWVAAALSSAAVVLSPLGGRSLVEACLSGTPVVAYDAEWQSELVVTGETGILVGFRNTSEMAEAVCDLLSAPDRAAFLGANARAVTRAVMDPGRLMDHERLSYRNLLGEHPRPARRLRRRSGGSRR